MFFQLDNTIYQYFVVVNPSEDIRNNVSFFKKLYQERFGQAEYLNSLAHISLCNFDLLKSREPILKEEFIQYLGGLNRFNMEVSGFHGFRKNGLLFLKTERERIIQVQRLLSTVLRQRLHVPKKRTQVLRMPHITIACSHNERQYAQSWNYFRDINYNHHFIVDKVTVLRKRKTANEKSNYELAFEVKLGKC